jgi:hypothetical protein
MIARKEPEGKAWPKCCLTSRVQRLSAIHEFGETLVEASSVPVFAAVLLSASTLLAAAPAAPAPLPAVRELRVGPIAETKTGMELVFAGPAAPCGERLKGSFSVFGSGGIPVDGTVAPHPEGGCSVRWSFRTAASCRASGRRQPADASKGC